MAEERLPEIIHPISSRLCYEPVIATSAHNPLLPLAQCSTAYNRTPATIAVALSDFNSPREWCLDLDRRWPERLQIKALLLRQIGEALQPREQQRRILELGIGDGELMLKLSQIQSNSLIMGVDINPELLAYSRARLGSAQVELIDQDLKQPWGHDIGDSFDLVYSLQSFHDLGGYTELLAIYTQIRQVLVPGGKLFNADFITPMAHDDPAAPRRFPPEVHLALLKECGFITPELIEQRGAIGCFKAIAP
ncbi:MAG: class I SAM-dependent methyltransferase [Gammaproteobacteria bacterium]|nr:class I SAM-dependent methyltransferase [Gammaproteobacteria bacterium]MBT5202743.1 class I SAM-dependent methyltransferase [Gammaproteobacteria bacterium]